MLQLVDVRYARLHPRERAGEIRRGHGSGQISAFVRCFGPLLFGGRTRLQARAPRPRCGVAATPRPIVRGRVVATPRPRRGSSADGSRRRRGRDLDRPRAAWIVRAEGVDHRYSDVHPVQSGKDCEDRRPSRSGRGDAAVETWMFRGGEPRRRRGRDADIRSRPARAAGYDMAGPMVGWTASNALGSASTYADMSYEIYSSEATVTKSGHKMGTPQGQKYSFSGSKRPPASKPRSPFRSFFATSASTSSLRRYGLGTEIYTSKSKYTGLSGEWGEVYGHSGATFFAAQNS